MGSKPDEIEGEFMQGYAQLITSFMPDFKL
jgi:hypothetical protein